MPSVREIDAVLRGAVEAGEVPGVVALAATDRGILYEGAFGQRDLAQGRAMTPDTIFRIASMTKAVTSVAAMQLVEAGMLAARPADRPVSCRNWPRRRCWRGSMRPASRGCARPSGRSPCAIC